jgi:hypothetical protein
MALSLFNGHNFYMSDLVGLFLLVIGVVAIVCVGLFLYSLQKPDDIAEYFLTQADDDES